MPPSAEEIENLKKLKVTDLKAELQKYSLPTTGKKEELLQRLLDHLQKQSATTGATGLTDVSAELDFDLLDADLDDLAPPPADDTDWTNPSLLVPSLTSTIAASSVTPSTTGTSKSISPSPAPTTTKPSAPVTKPAAKPVTKATVPATKASSAPPTTAPPSTAAAKPPLPAATATAPVTTQTTVSPTPAASATSPTSAALSEEQRRALRAERFGIPISEEEKKRQRANRFGLPEVDVTKLTLEERMKMRKEKFNAQSGAGGSQGGNQQKKVNGAKPVVQIDPETLAKRQARFGIVNPELAKKAEQEELERKRKERAERFGITEQEEPKSKKSHNGGFHGKRQGQYGGQGWNKNKRRRF